MSILNFQYKKATVLDIIQPGKRFWINLHGVRWRAECEFLTDITQGTTVEIIGRKYHQSVLLIRP